MTDQISATTRYALTTDTFAPTALATQPEPTKVYDPAQASPPDLLDVADLKLAGSGYLTTRGVDSVVGLHTDGTVKVIRVIEINTDPSRQGA